MVNETNEYTFSISPIEAVKELLKKLPTRRIKDVVEKRFALKGGEKRTLESIGREYRITRERVRQIEADAFRILRRDENIKNFAVLLEELESIIQNRGGVVAEQGFLSSFSKKEQPCIEFLLTLGESFHKLPENEYLTTRWTVNRDIAQGVDQVIANTIEYLKSIGKPLAQEQLYNVIGTNAQQILGQKPSDEIITNYLSLAKGIKRNPYGDYGLSEWPMIIPRAVRDKAYLVLYKEGKPMHFRDVARQINSIEWGRRKSHPQTVHNELIKDPRFVLVGRGLYALAEWGYNHGAVKDVLISILKQAGEPLPRDEIIKLVSQKRFVKIPTILLNLNNKSLFKKVDGEKYTLV